MRCEIIPVASKNGMAEYQLWRIGGKRKQFISSYKTESAARKALKGIDW